MTENDPHDPAGEWAPSLLPLLELPATPAAPHFDGTQLCAQVDPEAFFPLKGGSNARAKKVCGGCEFLNPCRRYALTARVNGHAISGVWGGTSERDRMRLRRDLAAAADYLDDGYLVDEDFDAREDVA